jgi:hypothetical protein
MPTICSSDSETDTHWLSTRVYTHLLGSQKVNRIDLLYNQGSQKYLKSQRLGSSFMKTIDSLRVLKELELTIL